MAGEIDQITDSLKTMYPTRAIRPMVNVETPFRKRLKRDLPSGARATEGAALNFAANMNPPQNVAQIADGATLPTPKDRLEKQWTLKPTFFVADFVVGWVTKKAATSQKSTFSSGGELRRRTEETITDAAKYIEQTYAMGHGTGRRAVILADGAANTPTLQFPEGGYFLRENHMISVRTTDGGDTVRDSCDFRKITAVDTLSNPHTFTYDGADQTLVAGDHVHIVAAAAQTGLGTGVSAMGLRGICSDGTTVGSTMAATFQNLSRATYPKTRANVKANPAGAGVLRNLTEQVLINACNENWQRSGKRITDGWINTGQAEKYIEFVAPDRTFPTQGGKLPGYVTGYDDDSLVHIYPGGRFNLHISPDIMPRELYLINMDTFFLYEAQELDWWDEGSMLKPVPVSGGYKAAWFAALASVENLGNDFPIGNTKVIDLKDPRCFDA